MTERANNYRRDGDPVRRIAFEQAMARFAGRRGLRSYMSQESIEQVEQYNGPVLLGPFQPA